MFATNSTILQDRRSRFGCLPLQLPSLRIALITLLLFYSAAHFLPPAYSQIVHSNRGDQNKPVSLALGLPVRKELPQGGTHRYQLSLTAGDYLHVVVKELSGFNVLVTLAGPDKRQLFAAGTAIDGEDSWLSTAESLKLVTVEYVADKTGSYFLEVQRLTAIEPGTYEIEMTELRPAMEVDYLRARAARFVSEGDRLRRSDYKSASFQQSLKRYDEALSIWRAIGDRKKEADTLNSIGVASGYLDRQSGSDYFKQALVIWQTLGDRQGAAIAFSNLGRSSPTGAEAISAMESALKLWRSLNDRRLVAISLYMIGRFYHLSNDMVQAQAYYEQALEAWQIIDDRKSESAVWFYMAEMFASLGDKQKCREYYRHAQEIGRKSNFRNMVVASLLRIGETYFVEGEFNEALDHYNQALNLSRGTGQPEEAYSLYNLGGVYFAFNDKETALDYFQQSLPLWQGNFSGEGYSLEYIGRIYSSLGQRQKAIGYLKQALPLLRATLSTHGEAYIWNDLGLIYAAEGDRVQALDSFRRALELSQNSYKDLAAHTIINIAALDEQSGDWQQANVHYNRALATFVALGHKSAEAKTRYLIARGLWKNKNPIGAREQIEAALRIVESLQARIVSDELRYAYFTSVRDYYDLYLELLMSSHTQDPTAGFDRLALEVNERGRARSLLEMLSESRVDIRQGVDQALLERERLLSHRLNDTTQRQVSLLSKKHTKEQSDAVENEIANLLTEYQQLQLQIRINSPRYAALTQPQPLSLKQIQQELLDPETVLLEYALGEDRSYLWMVSRESLVSYTLPSRTAIDEAARRFYQLLKTQDSESANLATKEVELQKSAKALSDILLGSVAAQLRAKRLLIVADGVLQYVPFAALADPGAATSAAESGVYHPLMERYEIIHLPSASTLAAIRAETGTREPAPMSVAVVADPVFSATDERVRSSRLRRISLSDRSNEQLSTLHSSRGFLTRALRSAGISSNSEDIPRLPYTRREAIQILSLVRPADRWEAVDFAASRQQVTSGKLANYRIVHLATHGVLDVKNPALSGLVFSLVDPAGQPLNGFLRLHDIYNLKLRADLVVLSACQTGLGKDVRGEGLVGLTRGFMYSGAPRVVTSLWKVDDAATAELMKYFYEAMLKANQPPAAALRTAQLRLWQTRRWHSPSNWSAFILQGEWR